MEPELDPISQVHNGLLDLLADHPLLAERIRPGNWVRYDSAAPEKDEISNADVPELRLVPTGDVSNLSASSTSGELYKTWRLDIATGDRRVSEHLFPLEWAALCALQRWPELRSLEWNGAGAFVRSVQVIDHAEGQFDRDLLRGIAGWTVAFTIRVHITMPRLAMLDWYDGEES
mgnify:CR=1 FL=1